MVIVTGVSNRSVGHLSVPHRSPVETIPEPSSVLNNKGVIFITKGVIVPTYSVLPGMPEGKRPLTLL